MSEEKWFVFWVVGATFAGNRNAGMSEFDNEADARDEMADIVNSHGEYVVVLVRGTEIERVSA